MADRNRWNTETITVSKSQSHNTENSSQICEICTYGKQHWKMSKQETPTRDYLNPQENIVAANLRFRFPTGNCNYLIIIIVITIRLILNGFGEKNNNPKLICEFHGGLINLGLSAIVVQSATIRFLIRIQTDVNQTFDCMILLNEYKTH